jgi:hypothetical protein
MFKFFNRGNDKNLIQDTLSKYVVFLDSGGIFEKDNDLINGKNVLNITDGFKKAIKLKIPLWSGITHMNDKDFLILKKHWIMLGGDKECITSW